MSDFGTMRDRIADELGQRTDLNTQINRAIQSAIKFYENERFWFNEEEGTASTVAATASYSLPDDFIEMDSVTLTVGDDQNALRQLPHERMRLIELTASGEPTVYSIYREELKLYPTPDAVYTLTMCYAKTLDALSATGDTNAWMVEGEESIRIHAKHDVRINILNQPENPSWASHETAVFRRMKDRTRQMVATGRLEPTHF